MSDRLGLFCGEVLFFYIPVGAMDGVIGGAVNPEWSFLDRVPLRPGSFKGDRSKARAILKGRIADESDGIRDGDRGKARAIMEGILINAIALDAYVIG